PVDRVQGTDLALEIVPISPTVPHPEIWETSWEWTAHCAPVPELGTETDFLIAPTISPVIAPDKELATMIDSPIDRTREIGQMPEIDRTRGIADRDRVTAIAGITTTSSTITRN